jgi:hypothetical protein
MILVQGDLITPLSVGALDLGEKMSNKIAQETKNRTLESSLVVWLKLVAIAHIVGGLCLSFNWPAFIWLEYRGELLANFDIGSIGALEMSDTGALVKMSSQLLGPTIASWGLLMFYAIKQIGLSNSNQSINFIAVATLVWFSLDTFISLSFGMKLHLIINVVALLFIMLPLLIIRLKRGSSDE